jgi:Adenylate kinase
LTPFCHHSFFSAIGTMRMPRCFRSVTTLSLAALIFVSSFVGTATAFFPNVKPPPSSNRPFGGSLNQGDNHASGSPSSLILTEQQRQKKTTRKKHPSTQSCQPSLPFLRRPLKPSDNTQLFSESNDGEGAPRNVKLIIAGAPASGKGTQCEFIAEKYNVVHLSTGDMLRAAVSAQTEVGKRAQSYMDSGQLVPDEVIINVVRGRVLI